MGSWWGIEELEGGRKMTDAGCQNVGVGGALRRKLKVQRGVYLLSTAGWTTVDFTPLEYPPNFRPNAAGPVRAA